MCLHRGWFVPLFGFRPVAIRIHRNIHPEMCLLRPFLLALEAAIRQISAIVSPLNIVPCDEYRKFRAASHATGKADFRPSLRLNLGLWPFRIGECCKNPHATMSMRLADGHCLFNNAQMSMLRYAWASGYSFSAGRLMEPPALGWTCRTRLTGPLSSFDVPHRTLCISVGLHDTCRYRLRTDYTCPLPLRTSEARLRPLGRECSQLAASLSGQNRSPG